MPFAKASTLRYSLRRNTTVAADGQVLQVRLGYCSRLISRSPSVGLPYDILEETPLSPIKDALFPLPLREMEDPLMCHHYVVQLLSSSSFKLRPDQCNPIAKKVASFVSEMAADDYDAKFQLDADIDWIDVLWVEEQGSSVSINHTTPVRGLYVEEIVVLAPPPTRALPKKKLTIN